MAQFLKKDSTIENRGITITGDGLGNQGIFSMVRHDNDNRTSKTASFVGYWYVDTAHKDSGEEPFSFLSFSIIGDDYDGYMAKEPQEDEHTMYLLPYKRAYDYVSDKAKLYNSDPENEEYTEFEKFKDIVDDPRFS